MRVPRIHTWQPLESGTDVQLEEQAARHLLRVLRMQTGDALHLFNGDGRCLLATIIETGKRSLTVRLEEVIEEPVTESPLAIHLGIAISKGDRMDWVVQKATELGVTGIAPLFTHRVDVNLNRERREKKQRHWRQVIASACEQCGRNRLPELAAPASLESWQNTVRAERKLVLTADGPALQTDSPPTSAALLIGPEGGLTDNELAAAENAGFTALGLGPRILRTETAPVAALAILQHLWGDM